MAPVTRRSQAGANAAVAKVSQQPKRVTRKQTREVGDSWDMLDSHYADQTRSRSNRRQPQAEEEDIEDEEDEESDEDMDDDQQIALRAPGDINSAVNPIREIADRVGKEVETFAETLDKYLTEVADAADANEIYESSRALVIEYKEIAEEMVEELKKHHERDLASQLRQEWSERTELFSGSRQTSVLAQAAAPKTKKTERIAELRRWQEEADTWDLFRIIIETQYRPNEAAEEDREQQLAQQHPLHHYSSEQEIWERFCIESDLAKQRVAIKTWFEQTAESSGSDLRELADEIERRTGVAEGGRRHGWMHSRERIKGEKRMRAWPNPIDSPLPQIRRSDNTELLVTTLDPDAPARQARTLEKPDALMDRAMWAVAWEMLRRGRPSEEIKQWFQDRNEGWRAMSIGNVVQETMSDALFRRMCFLTSQEGCSSDYEAAVYGLLGDNGDAVNKVCHSVDDKWYAYFSSQLQKHFDAFMAEYFASRLPKTVPRDAYIDPAVSNWPESVDATLAFFRALQGDDSYKEEIFRPMKLLQAYLLANQPESLVECCGRAVSDLDADLGEGEGEDAVVRTERLPEAAELPNVRLVEDEHALRMVANMAIIIRKLKLSSPALNKGELAAEENVIAAYVQKMRAADKHEMIPTYASMLSGGRDARLVGMVLCDIRDLERQADMMGLLENNHDLDLVEIVKSQFHCMLDVNPINHKADGLPLKMLEPSKEDFHPAQRLRLDFLPEDLDEKDQQVIDSLQYLQLLKGQWKFTFACLSAALRKALISGRLACARAIIQNYPYEAISERKTYDLLHRSLNMQDPDSVPPPQSTEEARLWTMMAKQSRNYFELQQLVLLIEAMADWRHEEHTHTTKIPRPASSPPRLKKALTAVIEAMDVVLAGPLFVFADSKEEIEELHLVSQAYVSELLIAYNAVLCSGGHLVTRECLLDAMELSTTIADEGSGLSEVVAEAGRMRELVMGFGLSGKAMLVTKAKGKEWKRKKGGVGRELGLWEISRG